MVFAYLEPKEAATFRWAGRIVAEIGLQYMASKVRLSLNEESYDRLLAVNEHPVVSKYVVELEYDTERLRSMNRKKFDLIFVCTNLRAQRQRQASSDRELSRIVPILSKKPIARQTKQLLNQAWSMYKLYQANQHKVELMELMTACCFSMEVCYYLYAHAKHIRAEMLNSNTPPAAKA